MSSLWKEKDNNKKEEKLKDFNVDVLIIGGGISGVSTAFYLKDSPLSVAVIESSKIASSSSLYTTGKITYLQGTYSDIEKIYNFDVAKKYLKSQIYACNLIKENIEKYNLKCNYSSNDSYIFLEDEKDLQYIKKEYNFFKRANINIDLVNKLPISFPFKFGFKVKDSAVFNPVKYIKELVKLLKNTKIYEGVMAIKIKKKNNEYLIKTNKNNIKAKFVVVCTQYPFFIFKGLIPFKTHIEKSHVIASCINKPLNFNAISVYKDVSSIRYYKDKNSYIIFSVESYKMSNHIDYKKRANKLREKFKKYFKTSIDYEWSTHDIVSNDLLPIIGEIDSNLLISTAFNKWGMTNGVLSGKILSDIILNKENEFIKLFNPKRKITLKRCINFLIDNVNIIKVYLRTKLNKNKSFYSKNVKFKNIKGKSYGIYIDSNNKKHIIRNICPHMKCSLIFNESEETWDCPCHGSKFDIDGNVIKGPSNKNLLDK